MENVTIATSAIKVFVPISQWSGIKKDRKASEEVTTQNNAKRGVARVTKSLLGDCAELKEIQKLVGQVRNHHLYTYTLPWDDAGWRLLTTALMPKFFESMTALQNEFYALVDKFIDNYEFEKTEAEIALGDMFNPADYPSADELRSKFSFKIDREPIPEAGDWRVDVQNEAMEELREATTSANEQKFNKAMSEVWEKLYTCLSKLSERIDYGDDDEKKRFHSSTVDNLTDLVDLLDAFNITNDPVLTQMRVDLSRAMRGVTMEALKEDAGLRLETKRALDDAISKLPSLMS